MIKKRVAMLALFGGVLAVDALAQNAALSGSSGAYGVSGTDTYGFKDMLVKMANVVSDDGLNKVVGFAGSMTGAVMAYTKMYVAGALTAAVSMVVGFLPKFVDATYGLTI